MSTVAAGTAATFCATLVDEWWRGGVREAVVCPGSRSTPLALALLRQGGIRVSVRLDERGAGFFALGLALATGRATVVLTTSGTAAAELHAAVVEAHHAKVPLLVCTADRPVELQAVGAPQTIDQVRLFGPATRWFADLGVPDEATRASWRSIASRALLESQRGPLGPGPVHLNVAFREPLVGDAGELPPGRPDAKPWHDVVAGDGVTAASATSPGAVVDGGEFFEPGARGVIVAGGRAGRYASALGALADRLGWPVIADPRSRCRTSARHVVGAADVLLRDERFAAEMRPDRVLRLGDPWASKVLAGWLSRSAAEGARHVGVEPHWAWNDPGREISTSLGALPALVTPPCETEWLRRWAAAEEAAQDAVDAVLAGHSEATEPGVARALYAAVPEEACIVVSSSMPVRDLEWFGRPRAAPPQVFSNRGANGIDGVVSTTLGVAAAMAASGPVYGLLGDLAVLHDASALVRPVAAGVATPAVLVVLDNDGGGIFEFLPQASVLDETEFEVLFGTPHEPSVADLARGCGYFVREIAEIGELGRALAEAAAQAAGAGLPAFVVVDTERKANVAVHAEIAAAVGSALATL